MIDERDGDGSGDVLSTNFGDDAGFEGNVSLIDSLTANTSTDQVLTAINIDNLNDDQRRAYNIIDEHLTATLMGQNLYNCE